MRSRAMTAAVCAAVVIAGAVPAAAEPPVDPAAAQDAAEQRIAADLAARVQAAEAEYATAAKEWDAITRAVYEAQRAADLARRGAGAATQTAGSAAGQAYRGGMLDDLAPLMAIVDPESAQVDRQAAATLALVAERLGVEALTKRIRAKTLGRDARDARARQMAVKRALTDAEARLAAVRAESAGAQLRAGTITASLASGDAERDRDSAEAWQAFREQSKAARVPTFTAAQLRSGDLPKAIVKVKGAPGVAKFRAAKRWLPALPNETVEAISFHVGALGAGYFWQAEMGTDCVRLTGAAWESDGTDLAALATSLPSRPAKAVHPGDQVFLANDEHGLYQTGIALDGARMIAADADSAAVRVVAIEQQDVWRVARPGAAAKLTGPIPQGEDPWRCGADPLGQLGQLNGTPRQIIEQSVLPWAMANGFPDETPASVLASNMSHGPTVGGGRSDHQGPGEYAWAADISNGTSPTPEMDRLAQTLATAYGMPWKGSGVTQVEKDGYTVQMLYRTNVGGNHFNHVHIAVRRTSLTPVPPPEF